MYIASLFVLFIIALSFMTETESAVSESPGGSESPTCKICSVHFFTMRNCQVVSVTGPMVVVVAMMGLIPGLFSGISRPTIGLKDLGLSYERGESVLVVPGWRGVFKLEHLLMILPLLKSS